MIRYADVSLRPTLQKLLTARQLYACRIGCLLDSYGLSYSFAEFYLQTTADGRCTGAAARYYHDITLLLTEDSDTEEWRMWAQTVGFRSLLCDRPLIPSCTVTEGTVMTLRRPVPPPSPPQGCRPTDQPELKALWTLLKRCEGTDLMIPSYEDFLPDLSHKLRHGTASCCVLLRNSVPVAAALTVAQTAKAAIIGGVAAAPEERCRGLGTWCVRSLGSSLADKTVFLMRGQGRRARFYQSCGFDDTASFFMHLS